MNKHDESIIDMEATGKWLYRLISRSRLSSQDIQEYLGMASRQSIYAWYSGRNLPTIDHLCQLSRLLGVKIDDMIITKKNTNEKK